MQEAFTSCRGLLEEKRGAGEGGGMRRLAHSRPTPSPIAADIRRHASPCIQDPNRDGGYLATSRMLLECALCIAYQEDDLAADPYASRNPGGVLTPSSAFGLVLHGRLRRAGLNLSVEDYPFANAASDHAKAA